MIKWKDHNIVRGVEFLPEVDYVLSLGLQLGARLKWGGVGLA